MTNKKITVVRKDQNGKNREFNIDLSTLPEDVLSALSCNDIKQSNFVSRINSQKEIKPGGTMPSPSRDGRENTINFGKGLDYVYGAKPLSNQEDYPEDLNPFASGLQKIKPSPSENKELSWFKSAVVTAKNQKEMHKVVDQALTAGIRINACNEGEWSFAEYVVLGTHFHKFKKGDQKKVIRQLMLKGAEFHDTLLQNKLIGEIYNELQPEVQPQIDKQLKELKKASENALHRGNVVDVEIDNDTYFTELSEDSTVEVAKVLEGTGLNKGWVKSGSHVIRIGDSEVEVRSEKGGERNYTDISDNSTFEITFPTSMGSLGIVVSHSAENDHQARVRVVDAEMWFELQKKGEIVGKGCLFGGLTVKEAVERGSFTRCGIWSEKRATREIKEASKNSSSETLLWVDRTRGGSKETFRQC